MLGWRLLSSLVLWSMVIALVALRYTHGVFLLIAITGLAAQREFYLSQQAAGRTVFLKTGLLAGALLYAATYFAVVSPYGRLPETFTGGGDSRLAGHPRCPDPAGVRCKN